MFKFLSWLILFILLKSWFRPNSFSKQLFFRIYFTISCSFALIILRNCLHFANRIKINVRITIALKIIITKLFISLMIKIHCKNSLPLSKKYETEYHFCDIQYHFCDTECGGCDMECWIGGNSKKITTFAFLLLL